MENTENKQTEKPVNTNNEKENPNIPDKKTNTNSNDNDDNNFLSNDNVDVGIKPDVKSNDVKVQFCSLSFNIVFNCCSKQKDDNE